MSQTTPGNGPSSRRTSRCYDNGVPCKAGCRRTSPPLLHSRLSSAALGTGSPTPGEKTGSPIAPVVPKPPNDCCPAPPPPPRPTHPIEPILPPAGSEKKANVKKRLRHSNEGSPCSANSAS